MPRGTKLTDYEKGQVNALRKQEQSLRLIESEIGQSHTVVKHFVNLGAVRSFSLIMQ